MQKIKKLNFKVKDRFSFFVMLNIFLFSVFLAGVWGLLAYRKNMEKSIDDIYVRFVQSEKICDIRNYGAVQNSIVTESINRAIEDCSEENGGVVRIPAGKWQTGSIKLKSNINLFLEKNAEVYFSSDLENYLPVVLTRFQGIEFYNYSPLIYANGVENVSITGEGKLIGNGDAREDWTGKGNFEIAREKLYEMSKNQIPVEERIFGDLESGLRPSFIQFVNSKNILLDGFTVENGPIWTIHPIYSENFSAKNLTIKTWSGNTDGIVIDSTKNVLIENCYFSTGDDAISIKSGLDKEGRDIGRPSQKILIQNIEVTKGSSGVSIGSEMSGGVSDVVIKDSIFKNARHGFRIKSTESRGGFIENVLVENVTMDEMHGDAIDFNLNYSSELKDDSSHKPIIKNIVIRNIKGSGNERSAIKIDSMPNPLMDEIIIENIFLSSVKSLKIKNAKNVSLKNIKISSSEKIAGEIENSQNIFIEDFDCLDRTEICLTIAGTKTKNIILKSFDLKKAVRAASGFNYEAIVFSD